MSKGLRAILIVDHGSRREAANASLAVLARSVADAADFDLVQHAHMEIAEPSIAQAFDELSRAGATEIVVLPYFLAPGKHATEDIPELCAEAGARHPGIRWRLAERIGTSPLLRDAVLERAAGMNEDDT